MKKSKIDLMLLGILQREAMHGYEIVQKFARIPFLRGTFLKMPAAYKALTRLYQQGYLLEETVQEGNTPPKKVYSITNEGIAYLRKLIIAFLNDPDIGPQFFWVVMRFTFQNITYYEFISIVEKRLDWLQNHRMPQHIKEKLDRRAAMGDFVVSVFRRNTDQMRQMEKEMLLALKQEAQKPENNIFFLEDSL